MDGCLCSNMRVGAMGGVAAEYFANKDAETIGFIGAGEQAKMHLVAMKTAMQEICECRVSSRSPASEERFISELSPLFPDITFSASSSSREAIEGADIIVTATSAQAPLLKAAWVKAGSHYSHVGGWEAEYSVALQANKIVVDDWHTVKHRTQTLSRMYKEGLLTDADIYANLAEVVTGKKQGRTAPEERTYFNAVGLSFVDVKIACDMLEQAIKAGVGQEISLQEGSIFENPLVDKFMVRPDSRLTQKADRGFSIGDPC